MFFQQAFSNLRGAVFLSALPVTMITGMPQAAFSASLSEVNVEQIYVFGDSLSDNGNVFQVTGGTFPQSPPYFEGRLSNGPVWVEDLASTLGVNSNNFAYGGASTGVGNAILPDAPLPGLLTQVNLFTATNQNLDPNALYTVWAGATDYLFGGVTNPSEPIANISTAVTSLYQAGARNIMVVNLPDLGKIPVTNDNGQVSSSLDALSVVHNSSLAATLGSLSQKPDINIIPVDVNSLFKQAIANPSEFGLTNVTDACLVNSVPCANPEQYLFWDEVHPTAAGHDLVGELALSTLQSKAVPEPSAELGILALGALGGVVLLKRKHQKASLIK